MKSAIVLIMFFSIIYPQILSPNNRTIWIPGRPSSEQKIASPIINIVTDLGADSTGTTDILTKINDGITQLSNGGILYFPTGKYRIDGSIQITKDDIILRGDGTDKTKLFFYNPTKNGCIEILTYGRGDWQEVSGYTKGTTNLTVTDASKFTIGDFAEIQQDNDTSFMYTNPEWNKSYAQNVVGQFMEITAINGNTITLKRPLHIGYQARFNPQIRPQRLIRNVGVEKLYIEMMTNSDKSGIYFKNAAYGWVDSVESYHSRKSHVASESSIGCEVTNSKFSRSYDYGGGGHGYGVTLGYHTTDWLVENNVFDSLRHAMIFSKGANGNVIAYNYSQNVLQGTGETNLNDGWIPPDISSHGHYPYMNLIEGNSAQKVGISDYWGPSGPGNTYFRNRILSSESQDGISYYDHSTKQNIIGNSAITIRDADGNSYGNLEHGNTIDGVLIWCDTISEQNLPDSYYLTKKPAFFGTLPWPIYGPKVGYSDTLPAQYRFLGKNPPTSTSSSTATHPKGVISFTYFENTIQIINRTNFKEFSLYSLCGRKIYSQNIAGMKRVAISTTHFSSGSYILKLSGANCLIKKILIR